MLIYGSFKLFALLQFFENVMPYAIRGCVAAFSGHDDNFFSPAISAGRCNAIKMVLTGGGHCKRRTRIGKLVAHLIRAVIVLSFMMSGFIVTFTSLFISKRTFFIYDKPFKYTFDNLTANVTLNDAFPKVSNTSDLIELSSVYSAPLHGGPQSGSYFSNKKWQKRDKLISNLTSQSPQMSLRKRIEELRKDSNNTNMDTGPCPLMSLMGDVRPTDTAAYNSLFSKFQTYPVATYYAEIDNILDVCDNESGFCNRLLDQYTIWLFQYQDTITPAENLSFSIWNITDDNNENTPLSTREIIANSNKNKDIFEYSNAGFSFSVSSSNGSISYRGQIMHKSNGFSLKVPPDPSLKDRIIRRYSTLRSHVSINTSYTTSTIPHPYEYRISDRENPAIILHTFDDPKKIGDKWTVNTLRIDVIQRWPKRYVLPILVSLIAIYLLGTYWNILGTLPPSMQLAQIIYSSVLSSDGDCVGNYQSLLNKLIMPDSYILAKYEFVVKQSGVNQNGDSEYYATVLVNDQYVCERVEPAVEVGDVVTARYQKVDKRNMKIFKKARVSHIDADPDSHMLEIVDTKGSDEISGKIRNSSAENVQEAEQDRLLCADQEIRGDPMVGKSKP